MIYILEINHRMPPKVWARKNKEEIMDCISEYSEGEEIYISTTGQEILNLYGFENTDELIAEAHEEGVPEFIKLANKINQIGLNTPLYRAFWMDAGEYQTEPIDRWQTYMDYNAHDLYMQKIFYSKEDAIGALDDDEEWNHHQGEEARVALKKLLD